MQRGYLFILEGPDGVGKTTLANALVSRLVEADIPCEYFAFPGRSDGTLGQHIYHIHHKPEEYGLKTISPISLQMLHIAAHLDAIEQSILPTLDRGISIVLDRYWWSTWVYGILAEVSREALDAMIQIELLQWRDIQPSLAFLIKTDTPYRQEYNEETWLHLSDIYEEIAETQTLIHPTYTIKNISSIEITINNMLHIIQQKEKILQIKSPQKMKEQTDKKSSVVQLTFDIEEEKHKPAIRKSLIINSSTHLTTSEVYETYWRFAYERQEIFFRKINQQRQPWSKDPILQQYKFTNAYRASDRVSQYLIQNIIYKGDSSPIEVFFRIMLFKFFNRIETWELLREHFSEISYRDYSFREYDNLLTKLMSNGVKIFSSAYIMPSGQSSFNSPKKHRNYLRLLERMVDDEIADRLTEMKTLQDAFNKIRSYPMMGDFLAFQYIIDINYSTITDFSEMDFVIPGPGAKSGIQKCFYDTANLTESDIIKFMAERQNYEFDRLELPFKSLWGRQLQLIDCQNLFCEVDKYSRLSHPHIQGLHDRKRIKNSYQPRSNQVNYWYPPKWNINQSIPNTASEQDNILKSQQVNLMATTSEILWI